MAKNSWQRGNRGRKYIPPLLSAKDEFVPETHIGMYELLTNPKDPAIFMSEVQCQKLRQDSYEAVHRLYQKYGSPDFCNFWNYNLEEINELGLNKFSTHTKLAPIVGLIECFEKKMPLKSNGRLRYIISFGIEKKRLTEYLRAKKLSKRSGAEVEPPTVKDKYRKKSKDLVIWGEGKLNIDGRQVTIDRNAVYKQFSHWCELNGVTIKNGSTMAIKYFVEHHPIEGLKDIKAYDVVTEFDKVVLAKPKDDEPDANVKVKLNGKVYELARSIIRLYNRDVENVEKETLTLEKYINNGVHLLNQNMPLKYRAPDLYEQQRQLELMELEAKAERHDIEEQAEWDEFDDEE